MQTQLNEPKVLAQIGFSVDAEARKIQKSMGENEYADVNKLEYVETEFLHLMPDAADVNNVYQLLHYFTAPVKDLDGWEWEVGDHATPTMWIIVSGETITWGATQNDACLSIVEDDMSDYGQYIDVDSDRGTEITAAEFWNRFDSHN